MRSYANYLAPHRIRVNSVHPTGVNTPMVANDIMQAFLESDPSLSQAMANALRSTWSSRAASWCTPAARSSRKKGRK